MRNDRSSKKKDSLGSSSHKRSSHAKDEFLSVTVRKEDPKQKAGIRLEVVAITGRVQVMNIATNGLFAGSEISIGDIVLSINGKRLQKGEGPDCLVEVIQKAQSKVTVVVKKTSMAPRVAEKAPRDPSTIQDNNVKQRDSYYAGQSKHKEDGSLAFTTAKDIKEAKQKMKVESVTISANKEDQETDGEIDESAGLSFCLGKKKLFVSKLSKDSIFHGTNVEVGDRVLSINDCNFRGYADANYAARIVKKAKNAVTMVVEKGVDGFTPPLPVDDGEEVDTVSTNKKSPTARSRSGDRRPRRKSSDKAKKRVSSTGTAAVSKKSGHSKRTAGSSDLDSTDSLSEGGSFLAEDEYDEFAIDDMNLPSKSSDYKEVVIAAPKAFSAQEVGVTFEQKKNKYLIVDRIQEGSIFQNTSLEPGDIVLEINDVNYRRNPDKHDALKTCKKTKETVTMLVWKVETKYTHAEFNLDASSTNLEWG